MPLAVGFGAFRVTGPVCRREQSWSPRRDLLLRGCAFSPVGSSARIDELHTSNFAGPAEHERTPQSHRRTRARQDVTLDGDGSGHALRWHPHHARDGSSPVDTSRVLTDTEVVALRRQLHMRSCCASFASEAAHRPGCSQPWEPSPSIAFASSAMIACTWATLIASPVFPRSALSQSLDPSPVLGE